MDRQITQVDEESKRIPENVLDHRTRAHQLQHSHTVGSVKEPVCDDLPSFGDGRPYPPDLPGQELYVVGFESSSDSLHPQNWKLSKKIKITIILIINALTATLPASIMSPVGPQVQQEFGVSAEVSILVTSLFVLGYAVGPIFFAPMSELYGRRLPIILAAFGLGVFDIGCATAKDYQTLVICRFFAGVFGASPLTVTGAVYGDMFSNEFRGIVVACFSATVFCGPFSGPFVGGFIGASDNLGWRWTCYISAILAFASAIAVFFLQDESFPPILLVAKAKSLRRLTRNWGIHAKQEEVEVDLKELITKNIARPMQLLFREPICFLVTLYISFIYGLLFLSLAAYDLIFGEVYKFSLGVAGLPYVAMIVGLAFGLMAVVLMNSNYVQKLHSNDNRPVPEWRLPLVMVGGILFAAGLFWLGWGGYDSSAPWIVPTLAGIFIGFGIYTIFLQCLNYIIDTYILFSASAIGANTILRSVFGAIFPLFAPYMFNDIGINWSMTLLGGVAVLFIPVPFIFYFKGQTIRNKSPFAVKTKMH